MEKAIEIKRRAQRCVQNGDVDGALREYEKLVDSPDADPYNYVLLADLLHKKGDTARAGERYLNAVNAYEMAGLFKNGIAVCKKMMRLSLSQGEVLKHLASLHAKDGLTSEASGYFSQYAEWALRADKPADAATALRSAFDHGQENVKLLERLSEVLLLESKNQKAAETMLEAAQQWQSRNQMADMRRCIARAEVLQPGIAASAGLAEAAPNGPPPLPGLSAPATEVPNAFAPPAVVPEAGVLSGSRIPDTAPTTFQPSIPVEAPPVTATPGPVAEVPPTPTPSSVMARALAKAEETPAPAAPIAEAPAAPPVLSTPIAEVAPAAPPVAHPRMDSSVFERAPSFVAPPSAAPVPPQAATPAAPAPPSLTPAPPIASAPFENVAPPSITPPSVAPVAPPTLSPSVAPPQAPVLSTPTPTDERSPEPSVQAEGIYDIGDEAETSYEAALREASTAEPPKPPTFQAPQAHIPSDPTPSLIARRPEELLGSIQNVEDLLLRAQTEFRNGHRDRASQALVEAALAYERLDRLDSAATIFRSLGRGAQAPIGVMELWLANCERRNDPIEGSQVACELGDRALNDGHDADAKRWFERSLELYAQNDIARRRLQRLANSAAAQAAPVAEPLQEQGRVAVAVGRGQAVTFDLNSLLQEFQRGVTSQLEGDAQGHYDLGMAYREMGLFDEAVGSFRIAERDIRLAFRAKEMIGRCLADSSRHDDALKEFEDALRSPTLDAAGEAELRLQLALSLAALGHTPDALAQLEIADMRFPGRPDVAERLAEWRRAFGQAA